MALLAMGLGLLGAVSQSGLNLQAQDVLPTPAAIQEALQRANDYFIANSASFGVPTNNWQRSAYEAGNVRCYQVLGLTNYLQTILDWANLNQWQMGPLSPGKADDYACGSTYLDMYLLNPQPNRAAAIKSTVDGLVADPTSTDDWWWIDALFMGAPDFAKLGKIYNSNTYYDKLWLMYDNMKTQRGLYNASTGLWFRDQSCMTDTSVGGHVQYWGRGNGWVIAALVKILEQTPTNYVHYADYLAMFQTMAAALKPWQQSDGFWRSSLIYPADVPNPETSGTGLITYALAWGVRNGVLSSSQYGAVVARAWNGMVNTALHADGKVGYIQAQGYAPAPAGYDDTWDYGVGAFLLAGSEALLLAGGPPPVTPYAGVGTTVVDSANNGEAIVNLNGSGSIVRGGSATFSWWYSNVFLASGITAPATLPVGSYTLTLQIQHSDGESFSSKVTHQVLALSAVTNVTASSYQDPNVPANTLDNNLGTRWSADGDGQWIQYALASTSLVQAVDVAFYQGDTRGAKFDLLLSLDGTNWNTVFSGRSSGTSTNLQRFTFTPQNATRVRLLGHGNTQSTWNSVTEVHVIMPVAPADANGDGVPDLWAKKWLGATNAPATQDSDGDGLSNAQEYIAGTNPRDKSDYPALSARPAGGQNVSLSFLARAAFGVGYSNQSRFYALERSGSLPSKTWQPVAGGTRVFGNNQTNSLVVPAQSSGFYRLRTWLENNP